MSGTDQTTDAPEKLARTVFVYTLLGVAAFVGAVLVYVL